MRHARKHPNLVWSAKVILILSVAVIVTTTALVFALSNRSILVESGITLGILALCLFVFLTAGLFMGVRLEPVRRDELDQAIKEYQSRGSKRDEESEEDEGGSHLPLPSIDLPDPGPPGVHPESAAGNLPDLSSGSGDWDPELRVPSLNETSAAAFRGINASSEGLSTMLNVTSGSLLSGAQPSSVSGGGSFFGGGGSGGGGSGFGGGDGGGLDFGSGGSGCIDAIVGAIIGVVVMALVAAAFAILIALLTQFIAALPIFIAALFYVFYRAMRVVFARSRQCRGRLWRSMGYGLLYTALYTGWAFVLLAIAGMLTMA